MRLRAYLVNNTTFSLGMPSLENYLVLNSASI